jgi:hypothetical protein
MAYRVKDERGAEVELELSGINDRLRRGDLTGRETAWRAGMPDWVPITDLPGVSPLQGIEGWLKFFTILLVVLQPLWFSWVMLKTFAIARLGFFTEPSAKAAAVVEHGWLGMMMITGMLVGWRMWQFHPRGDQLARGYLWVRLFSFLLLLPLVRWMVGDTPEAMQQQIARAHWGQLVREGLFFIGWWSYFRWSRRVANTYGHRHSGG